MSGRYYKELGIADANLKNVKLPEKIRCSKCNKWKAQSNFAKKRLNDLRQRIRDNSYPFTAQCTLCTPQQVMELRCHMCGKIKGLDEFAKAQRKNPDHAKCNPCMKEQLELDAIEDKRTYHGEVLGNSDSDDSDDSDPEYHSFNEACSGTANSGTGTATGDLIGSFEDCSLSDTASTMTGGFWTPAGQSTSVGNNAGRSGSGGGSGGGSGARPMSYAASLSSTSSARNDNSSSWGSAFNSMKYGHPGTPSVADSMDTNRPTSTKSSGWAKVKAFKAEPKTKADEEEDPWAEANEQEESSSEDDSDDEYK